MSFWRQTVDVDVAEQPTRESQTQPTVRSQCICRVDADGDYAIQPSCAVHGTRTRYVGQAMQLNAESRVEGKRHHGVRSND